MPANNKDIIGSFRFLQYCVSIDRGSALSGTGSKCPACQNDKQMQDMIECIAMLGTEAEIHQSSDTSAALIKLRQIGFRLVLMYARRAKIETTLFGGTNIKHYELHNLLLEKGFINTNIRDMLEAINNIGKTASHTPNNLPNNVHLSLQKAAFVSFIFFKHICRYPGNPPEILSIPQFQLVGGTNLPVCDEWNNFDNDLFNIDKAHRNMLSGTRLLIHRDPNIALVKLRVFCEYSVVQIIKHRAPDEGHKVRKHGFVGLSKAISFISDKKLTSRHIVLLLERLRDDGHLALHENLYGRVPYPGGNRAIAIQRYDDALELAMYLQTINWHDGIISQPESFSNDENRRAFERLKQGLTSEPALCIRATTNI